MKRLILTLALMTTIVSCNKEEIEQGHLKNRGILLEQGVVEL